jgi:hypothetical protein
MRRAESAERRKDNLMNLSGPARHSTAQHSTAQHSTAQHSTAGPASGMIAKDFPLIR